MGQRSADEGALWDARSREPQEPVGQSTTPWQSFVNLKVDYNLNWVESFAAICLCRKS